MTSDLLHKMTAVDTSGSLASTLASQYLASKGMGFKLTLRIKAIDFEYLVDMTHPRSSGSVPVKNKKKKSASALTRDAKRWEEYQKKTRKAAPAPASSGTLPPLPAAPPVAEEATEQEMESQPLHNIQCDDCGKVFGNVRALAGHRKWIHPLLVYRNTPGLLRKQ